MRERSGEAERALSADRRALRRYRTLLRLLPAEFRRRWGPDMEAVCALRLRTAGRSRRARLAVWCGLAADVATGALREWRDELTGRSASSASRTSTGDGTMRSLSQDLLHAARGLRRAPGAALVAVLTLALGIGASTAIFTVVDGILLEELPYEDPDRIVSVWPVANFNQSLVRRFAEEVPALDRVAGISVWTAVLTGAGDPVEIDVGRVTTDYFGILGVEAALGRTFEPEEGVVGNDAVVVLGHALWQSRFGGDPSVLGRTVRLSVADQRQHVVIGVLPAGFVPVHEATAWTPLAGDPSLTASQDNSWFVNSRIARLADGASVEQASEQVRTLAARLRTELPNSFDDDQVSAAGVAPLADEIVSDTRAALYVLLGAVGLVLLIACANVANLLLVRGEARSRDLAMRSALGAARGRLVRLLLVESLMLGVAGGALGVGLAAVLTRTILAFAPDDLPRKAQVDVDGTVLVFSVAATLAATILAGLWPALRASRTPVAGAALGSFGRAARGVGASRASALLVAVEVALAVVVAVGSGLMLRSLERLLDVDPGFDTGGVVVFRPNPLGSGDGGAEAYRQFYQEILAEVRAVPGVESAGSINLLTGTLGNWSFPTYPEGVEVEESEGAPSVNFRAVMPGYFETLRIPLLAGRTLSDSDRAGAERVLLVNQAFVDAFWPGEEPVGRGVTVFGTTSRVVGVVGDVRQHSLDREPSPEMYVPHLQWPWEISGWVVARTATPDALMAEVRGLVDRVDPDAPVSGLGMLGEVVGESAQSTRFLTALLSVFAVLGLALGAIGVYGVTAYAVARRVTEFGVRMALGATRTDVVRSALRHGLAPVLLGALVGVGLALVGGRALRSSLYEIEPSDPVTFALALLVLAGASLVALWVPAARASRVDPASALVDE